MFLKESDDDDTLESSNKIKNDLTGSSSPIDSHDNNDNLEKRQLTLEEKFRRAEMEKTAGWWNKYYASKAKLVRNYFIFILILFLVC